MNESKPSLHGGVVWPKPYLLQIYSRTISEGCIRIPLESEKQFKSLAQAFYRLRRRSDSQHASFILPEYHLVFATWERERGTALFTYDALPDGHELPPILSVTEPVERQPAPQKREDSLAPEFTAEPDFDPEQFVRDLVDEAGSKLLDESGDIG